MKKALLKRLLLFLCIFALIFTSACGGGNKSGDNKGGQEVTDDPSGKTDDPNGQGQTDDPNKQDDPSGETDPSGNTDPANPDDPSGNTDPSGDADDPSGQDDPNGKTDDNNGQGNQGGKSDSGKTDGKTDGDKDNKGNDSGKTDGDSGNQSDKKDDSNKGGIGDIIDENEKVDIEFSYNGKNYGFKKNIKTYMILGIDEMGEVKTYDDYVGTGQCDALYLLVMDHSKDCYTVLQLNRDSIVTIDVIDSKGKHITTMDTWLCLAHAYGDGKEKSCENTANTISRMLQNINIDGYAALNFDAIAILNDDLGGVEVYIEDDFSGYDSTIIQGTTQRLTGEQAYHFLRVRQQVSDGLNPSRMRRHRSYVAAFKKQFFETFKTNKDIITTMYNDVKPYMTTNLSLSTITNIVGKAAEYTNNGFRTIDGTTTVEPYKDGKEYAFFRINQDSLMQTVIDLFCVEVK